MRNYLVLGEWNVVCQRCGFKYKSSMLRREWTGLMVCETCWEPKHPQLMIKVPEEKISPPWKSPEPEDQFVPSLPSYLITESGDSDYNPSYWIKTEDGLPLITET